MTNIFNWSFLSHGVVANVLLNFEILRVFVIKIVAALKCTNPCNKHFVDEFLWKKIGYKYSIWDS